VTSGHPRPRWLLPSENDVPQGGPARWRELRGRRARHNRERERPATPGAGQPPRVTRVRGGRGPTPTLRPGRNPWSTMWRLSRLRAAGRTQTVPAGPTAGEYGGRAPCGSGLAVLACLVGWSEPGNQAKGGDGRTTRRPGEISIAPGSGLDKGHHCSCWPKPDDARPCTPQTCDWRCRACSIHGRAFYSHGDLQYLEHGTGPLAAELERLWRAKGVAKRRTGREGGGHDGDGWRALPRGAAGLAPPRPHSLPVTNLFYPGLQDPPPGQDPPSGHDGRNAGRGQ
jgi:hypothetical protein